MILGFGCAWVPLLLMTVQWLYVSALLVRKRSMMFSQTKHSDCRVCTFRFLACMPLLHRLPAVAMALVWLRFDHAHTTLKASNTRDCVIVFCSTPHKDPRV